MSETTKFVDLRVGHNTGVGDESVWPSFTDIMTVIVMIFLMALVVIMLRNFDLGRELLSTISDKEATLLANQSLTEEKTELESILKRELEKITALAESESELKSELNKVLVIQEALERSKSELEQAQIAALQRVRDLTANKEELTQRLESLNEQLAALEIRSAEEIASLTDEKQTLDENLKTVSVQLEQVRLLLQTAKTENLSLSEEVGQLQDLKEIAESQYRFAEDEILALKEIIKQREAENAGLQAMVDTSGEQFQSLQDEYESLDRKYRKLIRPARSTAGKHVVEVWVAKSSGKFDYMIRQPDDVTPLPIEKSQLESTLSALKARLGKSLYTKIVIPEDSELTHNEAWEFTRDILQKYDYYYQSN